MKGTPSLISLIALAWIWLIPGSALAGTELPADLKSIPIFTGSKVLQTADGPTQCSATLQVQAAKDTVAAFYRKVLEENGWKGAVESQYNTGGVLQFAKGADVIQIALVNRKKGDDITLLYNIVHTHKKK